MNKSIDSVWIADPEYGHFLPLDKNRQAFEEFNPDRDVPSFYSVPYTTIPPEERGAAHDWRFAIVPASVSWELFPLQISIGIEGEPHWDSALELG